MVSTLKFYQRRAVSESRQTARLTIGSARWVDFKDHCIPKKCVLAPAILEYDVVFADDTVSLTQRPNQGRFVALANSTTPEHANDLARKQLDTLDNITEYLGIFAHTNASAGLTASVGSRTPYPPDTT